jgi:hypothetical protein
MHMLMFIAHVITIMSSTRSVTVTVTVTMAMAMSMSVAHRIVKRNGLWELLVNKIRKTSVLKHILDLFLREAMVCNTTLCSIFGIYLVSDKIYDEEYTSRFEAFSQSFRCQIGLIKVMKPKSYACNVKVEEFGVCEGCRRGICGISQVALVGLSRRALRLVRICPECSATALQSLLEGVTDLILSLSVIHTNHILRKVNANSLIYMLCQHL